MPPSAATPPRRRPLTTARLLGRVALGSGTGALAGAGTAWLADVAPGWPTWVVGGVLTLLGAALGLRYGRGVVRATASAFLDASI